MEAIKQTIINAITELAKANTPWVDAYGVHHEASKGISVARTHFNNALITECKLDNEKMAKAVIAAATKAKLNIITTHVDKRTGKTVKYPLAKVAAFAIIDSMVAEGLIAKAIRRDGVHLFLAKDAPKDNEPVTRVYTFAEIIARSKAKPATRKAK